MPGPPPSFTPRRKNVRVGPTVLPAAGRAEPPPAWPLPGRPLKAELDVWATLWASPQAVAWEQLHLVRVVGRYCRILVESERRDSPPATTTEARQLEDRLGLTPKAMRALLWTVADDEPTHETTTPPVVVVDRPRLYAVDPPNPDQETP